ncbi:NAD(P)-binding protein [Metallosphaera hakonensis]|uniref:FAD-binding protein n=1 Tax=Metallosphaera hakonensis JCM 8857 = DSM 7519 TaxID=1293036 RepID=A0A2U9ISJ0_9CREN|nr:NAD(P)-binding protein [Metallosphaera hakonensis]AWR99009.1 NAD(P)-binding protein [Metallosphaera hakonensis JCM 8857 = DSM 7519]
MKLLEPFNIDDVRVRNRVVMSPMISNLGTPQGYPSEEHIAYLSRRTSSAGLIITEYTYVNRKDARGSPNQLGLYDDELVPKFSRLTDAIHGRGSKIFVQLVHVGRKTRKSVIWGNEPIAPSPIPIMDPVREMSEDDIARVIDDFVKASERAERAGFDGIEIHGAHGYLVAQFLSPATNKRNDKFRDGVLFLEELLKEVRSAVSIPVGMRISITEFDNEGLTPELVSKIISRVEDKLSYINLSAGRDGPLGASMPMYWKRPAFLEYAKQIRKPRVPLMLAGSIITLKEAEEVLEVADAVILGRQLLADPDWLPKNLNGEPVRYCIRCNQMCRGFASREVRCDVNPELGWEILPIRPGTGKVTVIGGGLTGLEASRILAKRGFKVTLLEKQEKLGGQLNWLMDPWKREFLSLLEYYENELKRLKVEIQLNVTGSKNDGLWAVPEETQPRYQDFKGTEILIDSNLYAYQDYAFKWSENNKVIITERSLNGLDRTRRYLLERAYNERGISIVKEGKGEIEFREIVKRQPSIGQSISRGYFMGMDYDP